MNLVLIGYRGTGKSAVAEELATLSGMARLSTDAMAEARAGCSIAALVARDGWEAFRDLEAAVVIEAASADSAIIDTGGGVVLRPDNMSALRRNGYVVWLQAPPEVIRSRIGMDDSRPSLTGAKSHTDEIEEVLAERAPMYAAAADMTLDTATTGPASIAAEIWRAYEQFGSARAGNRSNPGR